MSNASNAALAAQSDLAALRITSGALSRAGVMARRHGRTVYVYATPRGLMLDVAKPTIQEHWQVAPSGRFTKCNSGE